MGNPEPPLGGKIGDWVELPDLPDFFTNTKLYGILRELFVRRDELYPVGSIYMSVNDVNPQLLFGGEWEQIQDCFLLASGMASSGETGGEATHTLTSDEMPVHNHRGANSNVVYDAKGVQRMATSGTGTKINLNTNLNVYGGSAGGGQPHNNMPPFLTVNVWKRVA